MSSFNFISLHSQALFCVGPSDNTQMEYVCGCSMTEEEHKKKINTFAYVKRLDFKSEFLDAQ